MSPAAANNAGNGVGKPWRRWGLRALRYAAYPVLMTLAVLLVRAAAESVRLMQVAADMQSFQGASQMAWMSFLERLSLSWYTGASELSEAYAGVLAAAEGAAAFAAHLACTAAVLTLAQLALVATSRYHRRRALAWHISLCAVPALAVGVIAPMMTVIAHTELPVLGTVVLHYDSKSIVLTIRELWSGGQWTLGGVVLMFSILVPTLKLAAIMLVLQQRFRSARAFAARVLTTVGTWSMTDIFVVAVMVAYLAFDKDIHSSAQLGVGFWFFAAYCALSLIATRLATADMTEASRG